MHEPLAKMEWASSPLHFPYAEGENHTTQGKDLVHGNTLEFLSVWGYHKAQEQNPNRVNPSWVSKMNNNSHGDF
jgi:hypothetical protein